MKYFLLLLLLFSIAAVQAQKDDMVTVYATIICECIDNATNEEWQTNSREILKDCENAGVLGALISVIPTGDPNEDKSTTKDSGVTRIGKKERDEAYKILESDCDRYQDYAKRMEEQSAAKEDEITVVSKEACSCLYDVDVSLAREARYEKIELCISTAIVNYQVKDSMFDNVERAMDSLSKQGRLTDIDSLSIAGENVIIVDKNYKEIEEVLLRDCSSMKTLMTSDVAKSEVSVSDKKKAREFYDAGQAYFGKEDYLNAIKAYRKAVRKDRTFAFAWDMLGYSYRKNNEYEKAIECYEKSLELDPNGRMPLVNIPIAHAYLKNYDAAIESYKKLITIFKDDPEGYYGIGRIYHIKGDYENALDNTMKAYNLYNEINSPYARDAEANLGLYYRELSKKNQLDLFKKMAKKHNIQVED